jgi:uncharacterized protein (DUF362 family)
MGISRRQFLKLIAAGGAWWLTSSRRAAALSYRVGVGHSADPYNATLRAVAASGEWPVTAIAGRKVIIKPNLVIPRTAETGTTTDPQVVRALVDLALDAGAARVLIVEDGLYGAHFSLCGYNFFKNYDQAGRVALIDLNDEPVVLAEVPGGGLAYMEIYMPQLLLADDVVFISAAKLKCHIHTLATLTMKNLVGLAPAERYRVPPEVGRYEMHHRGISQVIVDLNLVRPVDFGVVDGVWAMEGNGPLYGDPVKMDLVLTGSNALAVDRVCLAAMGIPQDRVQHLAYAAAKGLGPADVAMVETVGDLLLSRAFAQPDIPPIVEAPRCTPRVFNPQTGQGTSITYQVDGFCRTYAEIVRTWDARPEVQHIRTLHDWSWHRGGPETLAWDGRDDAGNVVPGGRYVARVCADHGWWTRKEMRAYATGWVWAVCPDINDDGQTTATDIEKIAGAWRTPKSGYDLDGDEIVTVADIMRVATRWGMCP